MAIVLSSNKLKTVYKCLPFALLSTLEHDQGSYSFCSCLLMSLFFFPVPRKSSEESVRERQKVIALANLKEPSLLQFYISREWLNKFNTFTEPGPITNHTFLCHHGGIHIHIHINKCTCLQIHIFKLNYKMARI